MKKGTCVHFNGVQNTACRAAVNYRQLVGGSFQGWARRLPCFVFQSGEESERVTCDQYRDPTDAELEADKKSVEEMVRQLNLAQPIIAQFKKDFKKKSGVRDVVCPVCGGTLHMSISSYNGHVRGQCDTADCLNWIE